MRRLALALLVVLLGSLLETGAGAQAPDVVDNGEMRVNDHAFRTGADQDQPDISVHFVVWRDRRGDADEEPTEPFGHLWSKNLSSRDEAPIRTSLGTDDAQPRISGSWVVWTDRCPVAGVAGCTLPTDNDDIFARQLPAGPIIRVTSHPAHQMNPAIDGTTVVWEDYRNQGATPNVDLFMRALPGGAEVPVTTAAGNQTSPSISGTVVAWRDARAVAPDTADADVRAKDTAGAGSAEAVIPAEGRARSLSEFAVVVSSNRVLWNDKDPGCLPTETDCDLPRLLLTSTCTFGAAVSTCAAPTLVDGPGGIVALDLTATSRAAWVKDGMAYTRNLASGAPAVRVDDQGERDERSFRAGSARVEGTIGTPRFAWTQDGDLPTSGSDVYWRDAVTQPTRANSLSLGSFGNKIEPAADGNLVVYRRAPGEEGPIGTNPFAQLWATDLSPERRHFAVSTLFGTDVSRPAIVGDRIVWSQCTTAGGEPRFEPFFIFPAVGCGPIFQTTVTGHEPGPLTDLSRLGPPDADGDRTAYRCGAFSLCVHDGGVVLTVDVSGEVLDADPGTDAFSTVAREVHLSGTFVAWFEVFVDPNDAHEGIDGSQLHVTDVGAGPPTDVVVASGFDGAVADFDIAGETVVFSNGGDTIFMADATCGGGAGPCPEPLVTRPGHNLGDVAIDGNRVAWGDEDLALECCGFRDIYTMRVVGEVGGPDLVTNEVDSFVRSPYVDGDRIYWVDTRHGVEDVFAESTDPEDTLPGPDTAAPPAPGGLLATRLGTGIEVSWVKPDVDDFYRVRILRKSLPPGAPATAIALDDPTAAVVYEGSGATFTDTDISTNLRYSYSVYSFDYEPNFSGTPAFTGST